MLSSFLNVQQLPARLRQRAFTDRQNFACAHEAQPSSAPPHSSGDQRHPVARRAVLQCGTAAAVLLSGSQASAIGFKKELKKRGARSVEDYSEGADGLKTLELADGSGTAVKQGDLVTVHFDAIFKGIDVASSRSARLLGGNRTISEPLSFTAGKQVSTSDKAAGETAGGLFSGQSGPKPPPALSKAVIGMKPGGKRSVLVPPELAYGHEGYLEIPADAGIELRIELLNVDGNP